MNSFRLTAVGNLTRNPELSADGAITFARFCLTGHDEIGIDEASEGFNLEQTQEDQIGHAPSVAVTSLWFLALGETAVEIARNARKGDQLILEARIAAHDWSENGERRHGHSFIVTGFKFGAKRNPGPASPAPAWLGPLPHEPQTGAATVNIEPPADAGTGADEPLVASSGGREATA